MDLCEMDGENLCYYDHPKFLCGAAEKKKERLPCKFYSHGNEKDDGLGDCNHFDKHDCGDCDSVAAQFESWAALIKKQKENGP